MKDDNYVKVGGKDDLDAILAICRVANSKDISNDSLYLMLNLIRDKCDKSINSHYQN